MLARIPGDVQAAEGSGQLRQATAVHAENALATPQVGCSEKLHGRGQHIGKGGWVVVRKRGARNPAACRQVQCPSCPFKGSQGGGELKAIGLESLHGFLRRVHEFGVNEPLVAVEVQVDLGPIGLSFDQLHVQELTEEGLGDHFRPVRGFEAHRGQGDADDAFHQAPQSITMALAPPPPLQMPAAP